MSDMHRVASASLVARDVVEAYADWMLSKKKEIMDYFNSPDTPAHYKDSVVAMFRELDQDDSGIVQLDELLKWAAAKNPRQGSKVPDEFIVAQFQRVDLDGSGGLDFEECLLLQYLGCLNMLWCGCCGAFIDANKEDGYTCAACYGKFGRREKPGERQLDLCINCYESGRADEHVAAAGEHHSFVRLSDVKVPETVVCSCCGAEHGMVLGYMQGPYGDRHVRPMPGDPESWLCELCALTSCKCGQKFAWKTDAPRKGLLFHDTSALHEGGCPAGQPSLKDRWIASNAQRRAPHCKSCKESLIEGTMPFPADLSPLPSHDDKGMTEGVAAMSVSAPPAAASASPSVVAPSPPSIFAKQVVCICCQDTHDMTSALDGSTVKGYLYANGFSEHVKEMADGKFVCEWCAKYVCEKCGTHYADLSKPKLAKWSRVGNCPPQECCEATKWGGLASVRAGIRKKADDLGRGHCRTCRHKILTETLTDLSQAVPQPQPALGRDSMNISTMSSMTSMAPPVQQTVVCYCCQEIHDVTSALNGSRVPAYVHKDDFPEHTKPVAGGDKFVCEWCSKWKCHRCGALKWTDTRPEIGLWSESTYYCKGGCKPKEGGPHVIDRTTLRATAHDLSRSHCRTCREKIITGKLVERVAAPPKIPAGVAVADAGPPPKKRTDVGKVLGKSDDKSCAIQ